MSDQQTADFQEHLRTWRGFVRLMTVSTVAVVVILIVMALVLL